MERARPSAATAEGYIHPSCACYRFSATLLCCRCCCTSALLDISYSWACETVRAVLLPLTSVWPSLADPCLCDCYRSKASWWNYDWFVSRRLLNSQPECFILVYCTVIDCICCNSPFYGFKILFTVFSIPFVRFPWLNSYLSGEQVTIYLDTNLNGWRFSQVQYEGFLLLSFSNMHYCRRI